MNKKYSLFRKYWWETTVITCSLVGIILGIIGFKKLGYKILLNGTYETFRLFLLNYQIDHDNIPIELNIARWLIFIAFLLVTFRLFITIVAPRFVQHKQIQYCYKNHLIICGINEITHELIKKNQNKKIVVITDNANNSLNTYASDKIKIIIGNPSDKDILKTANIFTAGQIYAITKDDQVNVEITQSAYFLWKKNPTMVKSTLKCYALIHDCELKTILEETSLFKYTEKINDSYCFDGILLNNNEMGIKYFLSTNIEKILPPKPANTPEILIIGLNEKGINILLNLAHFLTMNRKNIKFTILEENNTTILQFKNKYSYLQTFTDIQYIHTYNEIDINKNWTTIFVCIEEHIAAIKTSISIRHSLNNMQPIICIMCDSFQKIDTVFCQDDPKVLSLKKKNILLVSLFEETIDYIVKLNPKIEKMAEAAHNLWREKNEKGEYKDNNTYESISEHHKQTNRNQVIDNYIRSYLATGNKLDAQPPGKLISFSDQDKETLAIMEHRRWTLEKYNCGWKHGEVRNDELKTHPDIKPWDELDSIIQQKDYMPIDLMINILNNKLL